MTASESPPSAAVLSWRGCLCLASVALLSGAVMAAPAPSQHLAARAEDEKASSSASASSTKSSDIAKESDKDAKAKGSEEDESWSQYTSVQVAGFPLYIWLLVLTGVSVLAFGVFWWWRTKRKVKRQIEEDRKKEEEQAQLDEEERRMGGSPNPEAEMRQDANSMMDDDVYEEKDIDGYSNAAPGDPNFLQVQNDQKY